MFEKYPKRVTQRIEKSLDKKPHFWLEDGVWEHSPRKESYGDCWHCKYYDNLNRAGYCSYRYELFFEYGAVDDEILDEANDRYRQIRIRVPTWPHTHKTCCCPAFESSWMGTNGPRDIDYAEDQPKPENWTHMLGG